MMYKNNKKNMDVFGFAWREMEKGDERQRTKEQAGRRGEGEKVYVVFEFPFRAHFGQKTALKCVSTWWIRFLDIFVKCASRLS